MKTNIGISDKNIHEVSTLLNKILAHQYVLYTKTLNYHWNIEGSNFHALHKFLEEQYEELLSIIDDVAERVRSVGGKTIASLTEFSKLSKIEDELFGGGKSALQMIKQLVLDHELLIKLLREDAQESLDKYEDIGTNNFLTEVLEKHEKMAWMLRAHLPEDPNKK